MREFKIYTCGRMSGIPYEEQMKWRNQIENEISLRTDRKVIFVHPPVFYGYHADFHKSEKEIMDWELKQICECDVIIVNLDGVMQSIGSHMELGAACGAKISSGKNISIIGVGKSKEFVHPWIEMCQLRYEETIEDAADYIAKYLLI